MNQDDGKHSIAAISADTSVKSPGESIIFIMSFFLGKEYPKNILFSFENNFFENRGWDDPLIQHIPNITYLYHKQTHLWDQNIPKKHFFILKTKKLMVVVWDSPKP